MNNTETHILIIWPKSRPFYTQIINGLDPVFHVEEEHEVFIKPNNIWLKKFYGRSLAQYSEKEISQILNEKRIQTGTGKALVLKVTTKNVDYGHTKTTNGISYVNLSCVHTKKRLRELTQSGFHLSDSLTDSEENQFHLKELVPATFKISTANLQKNKITDFFDFLNSHNLSYVSMRGHEYITEDISALARHKQDIDLLVKKEHLSNVLTYPFLVKLDNDKAERYSLTFFHNSRFHTCKIDIFSDDSGILPASFVNKLFSDTHEYERIKTLNPYHAELLALYHAVFHKRFLPKEKEWHIDELKNISTKSPDEILKVLHSFGLDTVLQNDYYPCWNSFPGSKSLVRKPLHTRLLKTPSGHIYFSYVFENSEGQIVKEGRLKNIRNEYSILKELSNDLPEIIPQPISFYSDEKNDLGILIMPKLNAIPFHQMKSGYWDFNTFKKHLNSALDTLKILRKHKIQHRDINPSNLFFTKDKIIFIDFGCALRENEPDSVETPEGMNSGFYKDPKGHNDLYSLVRCFTTKHIFPPCLKKILLSNDLDLIQKKLNSLTITEKTIISIFLGSQKLLLKIAPIKSKIGHFLRKAHVIQ
ncbi:MAG: RIO1 family regulatory kinase/ATPase [Candidatus Paceibacterota bacterium]|jgi:hypothetical protein